MIKEYIRKIIELCLPAECILCGGRGEHNLSLCAGCKADLPWLTSTCFQCGQPLERAMLQCGACIALSPEFFRTVSLFYYDNLLARCIGLFKFQHRLAFGKVFGTLFAQRIAAYYHEDSFPQAIIPVPLHVSRLKERGFNQALELAHPIAKQLGLVIERDICQRIKATSPQSHADSMQARRKNLKNALVVTKPIQYEHVAILDDVVTTTATVSALSKVLLQAGVRRVDVWCCARTAKK